MTCHLADKPHDCFTEHRRLLKGIAHLHSWTHIPCSDCKYARINAEICHVPETEEEDHHAGKHRWARINPKDFLDIPEVIKPVRIMPTSPDKCIRGHLYSEHGYIRKDGRKRCRTCSRDMDRERKRVKAQKAKDDKDKALMAYLARHQT